MVELRSSLLLLGIAQASLALLSLNRRLNNLEGAEDYLAPSVSLVVAAARLVVTNVAASVATGIAASAWRYRTRAAVVAAAGTAVLRTTAAVAGVSASRVASVLSLGTLYELVDVDKLGLLKERSYFIIMFIL